MKVLRMGAITVRRSKAGTGEDWRPNITHTFSAHTELRNKEMKIEVGGRKGIDQSEGGAS